MAAPLSSTSRPRILIVGAGFAALRVARGLRRAPADVLVIDRINHHLFQPLLYQVATAGLSPADITIPIRSALRHSLNTEVLLGEVVGVDAATRQVHLKDRSIEYDFLVLATGARHSYFSHPEWEAFAPGLKSISEATRIRHRILSAFERAEMESDPEQRRAWLNFVIVGAGATGTELAGSIADLAHRALATDFRHINPRSARVILIEAGPRVLPAFPESLSVDAERSLQKLGVEVLTRSRVDAVDANGVLVNGGPVSARTVIWAAGVKASPAAQWLGVQGDHAGRVPVQADLSVPGCPDVYALGDTALCLDEQGRPLPGVAPVAMQQGTYLARQLRRRLAGLPAKENFRYRDRGSMATIGRSSAIAVLGKIRLSGATAWWAWLLIHIAYLAGFRNRLSVMLTWAWSYLTYKRGARLITDSGNDFSSSEKKSEWRASS